ncbi:hypothetical protein GALMADRAFT_154087 [Galerina marginata CBS 339.88]|uniref:Proteasome assembly chaperone 1 n=1 Tax=Galerina marginata (strain CBS 339.88) TaxID=685588 RepID=A0A067T9R7_GALM3|nr:hypothetical protein GALMADRAFT_154087 [Galerina marginata CBS 339.88]
MVRPSYTVPPRYAVESDEEEDEINPLRQPATQEDTKVDIKISGELPQENTLVIASGDVGTFWAKGADLGEQTGAIFVNRVQIGLAFNPKWTKSTVIVSETLSRLPLYAMHTYAKSILDSLNPKRVSLLDSYPAPTYATDEPIPFHEAPIRYLSTSEELNIPNTNAELFAPPNLIQSTSASFLSILAVGPVEGTLILLPSPHTPHPPPKEISPSNFSHLSQDSVDWSTQQINLAQKLVFQTLGEKVDQTWKPSDNEHKEKAPKRSTEIGEGGMYI